MKGKRIWALILRYSWALRDPSRITDFLFWPVIDIGYFGLIALWSGVLAGKPELVKIFVTALVFWQIIYRSNLEICVNLMDEFLERNLINLLASPLLKREWILAMMITSLVKSIFTFFLGVFVGFLFFQINVLSIGWPLFPFVILCLISGWIIGFVAAGIIIYQGPKLQQLPWVVITIVAIFSAILYPLEILPQWLRLISQSLPMSYIFQGIRQLLITGQLTLQNLFISALLNVIYLSLAIQFFLYMHKQARKRGFKWSI